MPSAAQRSRTRSTGASIAHGELAHAGWSCSSSTPSSAASVVARVGGALQQQLAHLDDPLRPSQSGRRRRRAR
jgi:hypothetical protein